MNMSRYVAALLAVGMASADMSAHASGAVAGATEPTQILNNIQLIASYAEHAQQTVTQMNQYQTMLRNLMQMTPSQVLNQSAQQLFTDRNMLQAFRDLRRIVVAGQSTSYTLANIDAQFKQQHPGYNGYGRGYNFGASYADWSDNTLNSVKNALSLMTAHTDEFESEQGMIDELQRKSQTAEGQLQALQAGNQVGIAMVSQMQMLRQMQMAQAKVQADYIAGQQSDADARKSGLDSVYKSVSGNKVKQSTQQ